MSAVDRENLQALVRARHPLLVLETSEERRVEKLFAEVAITTRKSLWSWSSALGLKRCEVAGAPEHEIQLKEPAGMLNAVRTNGEAGIYLLYDFHAYMDEPEIVRLVKEIALAHPDPAHTLVMVSHSFRVPEELRSFASHYELSLPDDKALEDMVQGVAVRYSQQNRGRRVKTSRDVLNQLVMNLRGLTMSDATRLAHGAIYDDGAIDESDLPEISRRKYELLDRSGALSFEYDTAKFSEVGGLARLSRWLQRRKPAFLAADGALDRPKGLLLVGVQGCGKSLAAKAVAGMWSVPLLRLDFGTLFNKFFGETEKNLREALKAATAMAPCVLWVDEIEKAIAQGDYDSGTSRRMLGTLLTWMAENDRQVFIVATANDISGLPPELIRKGRLDEIFWVDLPKEDVRTDILRIHLARRGQDAEQLDLAGIARASAGFSGAELEQAVVSALYYAREENETLADRHLLEELQMTRPLSVVMGEQIAAMRAWAQERCVMAD